MSIENYLRKVMVTLTPFTDGKIEKQRRLTMTPDMVDAYVVKRKGHMPGQEYIGNIIAYKGDLSGHRKGQPYIVVHMNVAPTDVLSVKGHLMKLGDIEEWIGKPEKLYGYETNYVYAKLRLPPVQEVNSRMSRISFKDFLNEARKRPSMDIGVVDVSSAIDEHRHLARRLAVINALAKKMSHRVTEIESLLMPIVRETEAQQLTIGNAIVKYDTRKHTSVAYKHAFEKALEMVNEEQQAKLKEILETVTHRDTKEFVEMVDTEVSAVLDKVKAAEKADDTEALEKLLDEIMHLSNRIKEGRFTDHVVKAFGWTHLSHMFHTLYSKVKGLRKKIDWLQHVADHPEKYA